MGLPTLVTENGVDTPLDYPFTFGAAPSSAEVPERYQVALAGMGFVIDEKKYRRQTIPLQRQPTDESVEPGEQSLNTQGVWRRSQDNWFLGAGQEYLDNRFAFVSVYTHSGQDPSIRTRFWRSKGVNPWVEGKLSLLPECNQKKSSTGTGQLLLFVGSDLYYWDGTTLYFTSNPTASSPTWTTVNYPTGLSLSAWPTITSMTTDGNNVFLAVGTYGVFTTTAGSTSSTNMRPVGPTPTLSGAGASGGATTYTYYIIATDANGYKSLVGTAGQTTSGQASLSAAAPIILQWTAVNGAVSYDVLKTNTSTALALAITQTSFTDTGGSTSSYTAPTATTQNFQSSWLCYGQGFLVGSDGPLLAQVLRNGATSVIWTHQNPNFNWVTGASSPNCFYVAGVCGNVSELYATQVSSTTGNLAPPYIAGAVTVGELIRSMVYYQGIVVVTTSLGARTGQPSDSAGHLTIGPVITDMGDSKCCTVYGPYVYVGWSSFSSNDGVNPLNVTSSGVGRLFLSEFTDSPLLPAYATDCMATDGTTGTVTSCAVDASGNIYFTLDANGVWGPDGNLVSYGYVEPGWIRYGLIQAKTIVSMDVRHDKLPAGASVGVQVVPFQGTAIQVGTSNQQNSIGPNGPFGANYSVGEAFMPILTLNRGSSATTGPTLRRFTVAALPVVARQDEIIVPLMIAREVRNPVRDGEKLRYEPYNVFTTLKALESNSTVFQYQEGGGSYNCIINQIELEPNKWVDDFSFFEGLFLVHLFTLDTQDV